MLLHPAVLHRERRVVVALQARAVEQAAGRDVRADDHAAAGARVERRVPEPHPEGEDLAVVVRERDVDRPRLVGDRVLERLEGVLPRLHGGEDPLVVARVEPVAPDRGRDRRGRDGGRGVGRRRQCRGVVRRGVERAEPWRERQARNDDPRRAAHVLRRQDGAPGRPDHVPADVQRVVMVELDRGREPDREVDVHRAGQRHVRGQVEVRLVPRRDREARGVELAHGRRVVRVAEVVLVPARPVGEEEPEVSHRHDVDHVVLVLEAQLRRTEQREREERRDGDGLAGARRDRRGVVLDQLPAEHDVGLLEREDPVDRCGRRLGLGGREALGGVGLLDREGPARHSEERTRERSRLRLLCCGHVSLLMGAVPRRIRRAGRSPCRPRSGST